MKLQKFLDYPFSILYVWNIQSLKYLKMKKLFIPLLLLLGLNVIGFAQSKAKSPVNKLKIEADGLFISTTEEDLEGMLEMAAKLDKIENSKACTVELIGTVSKNGTEYKVSAKTQRPTCAEAVQEVKDAVAQAKAAIVAKIED